MDYWTFEVKRFVKDEMANALYNIAAQLSFLAKATDSLNYGPKYGKGQAEGGMSIAEAIEVSGRTIAEATERLVESMACNHD